jgi:hypothetical protein
MHAWYSYSACSMKKSIQYTIRSIPERTDRLLRETAAVEGASLNRVALDALAKGLGAGGEAAENHDLDDLAGSWVADPECDRVLEEFGRIDPELWS